MPVAHSPAHYINSSKGCSFITESFPLCCFLVVCHSRGIASGAAPLTCNEERSAQSAAVLNVLRRSAQGIASPEKAATSKYEAKTLKKGAC
jgi:hypothetical protein